MRYYALATDYDGTIAEHGRVDEATIEALRRVSASGRKLILVTGRLLPDLLNVLPELEIFDLVVAENGALLYSPLTHEETLVAEPVPEALVSELDRRGVPISRGKVIVATWEPNETAVLEAIRDLGLEMQVIFNKGAVMVLPSGSNKASGLAAALTRLELSAHNVVGVGDAENDHAFLSVCELAAAPANALPQIKERVDYVAKLDHGAGVVQLIEELIEDDLVALERKVKRHQLVLGADKAGKEVSVSASGPNILLTGASGSGKSTLAKAFLERLTDAGYQYCVVDPEGDYEDFEEAVVLGNKSRVPAVAEVIQLLKDPTQNAVVNLLGVPLGERPQFFATILTSILEMRARTGRPHWLMLDEAHHILPAEHQPGGITVPGSFENVVYITVEPHLMLTDALKLVDTMFVVGESPAKRLADFATTISQEPPKFRARALQVGEAAMWERGKSVRRFMIAPTRFEHRRHRRKYAEGDVGPDYSFYFHGHDNRLNLRAQNLILFAQIAEGVDEATWQFHLRRGDYTHWFRDVIKDTELAEAAESVRRLRDLSAYESRKRIREAIAERYTLPGEHSKTSWNATD